MILVNVKHETWPIAGAFTTSHGCKKTADVVVVELKQGQHRGWGECVPYPRYDESVDSVIEQINSVLPEIVNRPDNNDLQALLPPGAARNALDCTLWDLRCKQQGMRIWELLGIPALTPFDTAFTLSDADLDVLAKKAKMNASRPLLKVKLFGVNDAKRIVAVRENAPDSQVIVDANEGWAVDNYKQLIEVFLEQRVDLIEQPFHESDDNTLCALYEEGQPAINLCADESCHTRSDLPKLKGKYNYINIKLDKTGGLTEAMALAKEAKHQGFGIMVGCMVSTSLSVAPASLLSMYADYCDLDGPLLLAKDRQHKINYEGSTFYPYESKLWG